MSRLNTAEELQDKNIPQDYISVDNTVIQTTDVMTGDRNRNRFLYYQLKISIMKAQKIDIIVSFLMESGVRMILKDLKAALNRGFRFGY